MGGFGRQAAHGIMEWWPPARRAYGSERKMEDWKLQEDGGLIKFSDPWHQYKNRFNSAKPNIPTFHYSITPCHSITAKPVISHLAKRTRFSMVE
jgi:hypothetical protein